MTLQHAPGVEQSEARRRFQTLYGRALMDPSPEVLAEISKIFEKPVKLFLSLMRRACPQLSAAELDWRVNCIIGAQVFSLVYRERLGIFFGAEADVDSIRAAKWMLHFLMNGIDAPALPVDGLPSKGKDGVGERLKLASSQGERQANAALRQPILHLLEPCGAPASLKALEASHHHAVPLRRSRFLRTGGGGLRNAIFAFPYGTASAPLTRKCRIQLEARASSTSASAPKYRPTRSL